MNLIIKIIYFLIKLDTACIIFSKHPRNNKISSTTVQKGTRIIFHHRETEMPKMVTLYTQWKGTLLGIFGVNCKLSCVNQTDSLDHQTDYQDNHKTKQLRHIDYQHPSFLKYNLSQQSCANSKHDSFGKSKGWFN